MPFQKFPVGFILVDSRGPDLFTMDRIVRLTVIEIILEPSADMEPVIGSDRDVATVVEAMDVGPHEDAVIYPVLASLANGFDVGCIQDRQSSLPRYSTVLLVHIGDD